MLNNGKNKTMGSKPTNLTIRRLGITLIALIVLLTSIASSAVAGTVGDLENGAKVFQTNCAGCHVKGKNIVRRRKNLKLKALHRYKVDNLDAIASLVTNGKGIMSAYGDKLTAEEIANVSSYVLQRAEQNWK